MPFSNCIQRIDLAINFKGIPSAAVIILALFSNFQSELLPSFKAHSIYKNYAIYDRNRIKYVKE